MMDGGPHEPIVKDLEAFPAITGPITQRAMQLGWRLVQEGADGASFRRRYKGKDHDAQAIVTAARERDGKVWVHVSLSLARVARVSKTEYVALPSWAEITRARDDFLGPQAKAVMVVAPKSEHVNISEVHHIWHCPEGDGLPDFTHGTGSI